MKKNKINISFDFFSLKPKFIFVGFFFSIFLISLLFYFTVPQKWVRRTFFFHGTISAELSPEVRYVPKDKDLNNNLETLIEEIILGPMNMYHSKLIPKTTKLRTLFFHKGSLYIDFDEDFLLQQETLKMDFEETRKAIIKTMRFNFPQLKEIKITINGQLPFEPYFVFKESNNNVKTGKNR